MDMNNAFLNKNLKEKISVKQPYGFKIIEFPDHVDKLDKALYELKKIPRVSYETLLDSS